MLYNYQCIDTFTHSPIHPHTCVLTHTYLHTPSIPPSTPFPRKINVAVGLCLVLLLVSDPRWVCIHFCTSMWVCWCMHEHICYICVCKCACVCVKLCVCVALWIFVCMCVCWHGKVWVMCMCVCWCVFVWVCMWLWRCGCVCTSVFKCIQELPIMISIFVGCRGLGEDEEGWWGPGEDQQECG